MVGFMPCPAALLADWSAAQVEELRRLYQRAYELARQAHAEAESEPVAFFIHGRN
jgi:NADPH-dependent ferric siderophore reductase